MIKHILIFFSNKSTHNKVYNILIKWIIKHKLKGQPILLIEDAVAVDLAVGVEEGRQPVTLGTQPAARRTGAIPPASCLAPPSKGTMPSSPCHTSARMPTLVRYPHLRLRRGRRPLSPLLHVLRQLGLNSAVTAAAAPHPWLRLKVQHACRCRSAVLHVCCVYQVQGHFP
jgi:hypothetical protein